MSDIEVAVRAELDVPGETGRQGRVFQIWLACLLAAVLLVVLRRPATPSPSSAPQLQEPQLAWKRERVVIALALGLALPGMLSWWVTYRRRRGGAHARGVVVDVTRAGELRLWGRGYGDRVALPGAEVSERLVDVFTGRMGAWRQRRLRVRASRPLAGSRSTELELATVAIDQDDELGLRLDGGEGDCIELSRADFIAIRDTILRTAAKSPPA